MSKSNSHPAEKFHFPNSGSLWHDSSSQTRSMGCQNCPFLESCGGLNVGAGFYDCLTFCRCADPSRCDNVCPNNAQHFVARSMEVRGFDLGNVAIAPSVEWPVLPLVVPMIYHGSARTRPLASRVVALSLYSIFGKDDGVPKFRSRRAFLKHFKLSPQTAIILSGTDDDRSLERWWKLTDPESVVASIRRLGISLITAPNFSLFNDVPRHDNMFNMKRIAVAWSEIQRQGVACALHLNGRTEPDFERWTKFLNDHPEIRCVAFELGTGAGARSRTGWHVLQLRKLAASLRRPLHLIVRGGLTELVSLRGSFSEITLIDTGAFVRAQRRRRAELVGGKLSWVPALTAHGAPIDDLLDTNIAAMEAYVSDILEPGLFPRAIAASGLA